MVNSQKEFWKGRSEQYNNLKWANDKEYLNAFFSAGNFKSCHSVLDVGTGTGIVARRIAPYVKDVFALDSSYDMARKSNWQGNIYFINKDIRQKFFAEKIFDRITARMVFHHILKDQLLAINNCYHYLKKGGLMILSEGLPPLQECYVEYKQIFDLKEERITFTTEDLFDLMYLAGFKEITTEYHIVKNFSVMNWLDNGNISDSKKKKIFDLHINGSDALKKAYNMRITKDNCFIDVKNVILVGGK